MSGRDELREWILARAHNDTDAKRASKMIAGFVADAVRADREKRSGEAKALPSIPDSIRELMEKMKGPLDLNSYRSKT